jgi:DUF3072 family protein
MKNLNEADAKEKNPMSGSGVTIQWPVRKSLTKTLSEECNEPGAFAPDLTKAEASKRIDAIKAKRRPVRHR